MTELSGGRWTKWWWLRLDQAGAWSKSERRAVLRFLLTWMFCVILISIPALPFLIKFLALGPTPSLVVWFFFGWPLSLPSVRRLTSAFFPRAVMLGDDAAAERLGGRVHLPSNEFWIRGFWWIDAVPIKGNWSDEQIKVRARTLAIALCIFLPTFFVLADWMASRGVRVRIAALVAFVLAASVALYSARRISVALWRDLVRKADDDAVRLADLSVPPRT